MVGLEAGGKAKSRNRSYNEEDSEILSLTLDP